MNDFSSAVSQALRLQLEIDAGRSPSEAKSAFFQELEQKFGRGFVDLVLTIEAVFRPRAGQGTTVQNYYSGNFANFNLGQQTGSINATINAISNDDPKSKDIVEALRSLTEQIAAAGDLDDPKKQEALESVETIAAQAGLPKESRKMSAIKAAIHYLPTVLSSSAASIKIWEAVHPAITHFFSLI